MIVSTTSARQEQETLFDPEQLLGETLQGTYKVEEFVGEGGMAFVYRATHHVLQGPVAIKLLQQRLVNKADFRERFLREARMQYQVQHPHIVRVLDFLDTSRFVGCVQEWCDGGELSQVSLPTAQEARQAHIVTHFVPLLDALGHIHQKGYIHRDIKPSNILLQHMQEGHIAWKLNDFGLLKDLDAEELTQSGAILGTFHYISPEQFEESRSVDHRTDIYSIGVVLYQLLCGRLPFTGKMPRLALQILESPVTFRDPIHPALQQILRIALAKRPKDRFQDCATFKHALQQALQEAQQTNTTDGHSPTRTTVSTLDDVKPHKVNIQASSSLVSSTSPLDENNRREQANETIVHSTAPVDPKAQSIDKNPTTTQKTRPQRTNRYLTLLFFYLTIGILGWYFLSSRHSGRSRKEQLPKSKENPLRSNYFLQVETKKNLQHSIRWARKGNWGQTRFSLRGLCQSRNKYCYDYGRWLHYTLDILKQSCQFGDKTACHWQRVAQRKGYTRERFLKKAIPVYRKACRLGESAACVTLARIDDGTQTQEKKAWLERACRLKNPDGCIELGQRHIHPKREAIMYFRRACRLHEPKGCLLWGLALQATHPRTKQEQAQIHKAFQQACQLHDKRGCRQQQRLKEGARATKPY